LIPESPNCELSVEQEKHVQPVSETDAHITLQNFLYDRGIGYRGGISSPLSAFTVGSRLSVHLAWGTITGRTVYQKTHERMAELKALRLDGDPIAGKFGASLRSFSSRLHWRDHFIQRLESEPEMELRSLNPAYEQLEYDNNPDFLEAWKQGQTGYPMVDACIRCLKTTGFINFRMRAMLTSFACHLLHLDWKLIDKHMAQLYTDYEPGIHLSQLQMQAGVVGINTVRIYSPTKQIIDQDPDTVFIKKWIPELRAFSPKEIIDHREKALGNYPGQLVEWKAASSVMRKRIYAIRRTKNYKEIASQVYDKHGSRRATSKRKPTKTNRDET
jgi:deoxyribodipyrimidine photo-lyase